MSQFEAEIKFLNRKLSGKTVQWQPIEAMSQIATPPVADAEAKSIIGLLRDSLAKKAIAEFPKIVFSMTSKLRGGSRVIINVKLLREFFGDEIEMGGGGGGKSYNPFATKPRPPGRGV